MIVGIAIGSVVLLSGTVIMAQEFMIILDQARATHGPGHSAPVSQSPAERPRRPTAR